MAFLYEEYDNLSKHGVFDDVKIPSYITENLRHVLRGYQKEGLKRYLYFSKNRGNQQKEQMLFNMATGAGKTLMMAAFILEKYKQGERNFIFMVNRDNIITKTRDNLLNASSLKYLFADKIEIDGEAVAVREVQDFSDSSPYAINLHFTTIQKLHQDLHNPRENRLSFEQFEDLSVVILADEAHHLNSGLKKKEKDENATWTDTITKIQNCSLKSSWYYVNISDNLNLRISAIRG
ncbi:MAG: DEAD/DEAH box helicase family protein [Turicibacter sp.]|nr:DEAD/DEAH box helicase family protein [Turicibacter sp.]